MLTTKSNLVIRALAVWLCVGVGVRAQWTTVTADNSPVGQNVGGDTSLAVVNNNPAISYFDIGNEDLKYVRATNASGAAWGTPITIDTSGRVGQYPSLEVVNGNPAISYFDWDFGDLNFIRALDADGTVWGTRIILDSASTGGYYSSLAIVNGNPAISYYAGDLKYIRATNASGTAWGAPVTIDSVGDVGLDTSLAIVNGNPAISYFDYTNGDLKYVRATNATGALSADWGAPIAIDTVGRVGMFTSLAVVDGNPAISYYDFTNADLKYVRATNATGALVTDWGVPITIESAGIVGLTQSLAFVNGSPAISYYDPSNLRLKYVEATNSTGALLTDWGMPMIVDTEGGAYNSLALVNGNAAISYYDYVNDDLKFAYFVPSTNASRNWASYE